MKETEFPSEGAVIVRHNGRKQYGSGTLPGGRLTPNEAFAYILGHQGQSVTWAMENEGWTVESVPTERWSDAEAAELASTAAQCLYRHDHNPSDRDPLTRENCGACVLAGYYPRGATTEEKRQGPNYAGWARVYVQARRQIPARWADAFAEELASPDNPAYAAALAMDIATWGVHHEAGES